MPTWPAVAATVMALAALPVPVFHAMVIQHFIAACLERIVPAVTTPITGVQVITGDTRALATKEELITVVPPAVIVTRKIFLPPPAQNAMTATVREMVVEAEEINFSPGLLGSQSIRC
jgi:hypothetical protein